MGGEEESESISIMNLDYDNTIYSAQTGTDYGDIIEIKKAPFRKGRGLSLSYCSADIKS